MESKKDGTFLDKHKLSKDYDTLYKEAVAREAKLDKEE